MFRDFEDIFKLVFQSRLLMNPINNFQAYIHSRPQPFRAPFSAPFSAPTNCYLVTKEMSIASFFLFSYGLSSSFSALPHFRYMITMLKKIMYFNQIKARRGPELLPKNCQPFECEHSNFWFKIKFENVFRRGVSICSDQDLRERKSWQKKRDRGKNRLNSS